MKGFFQSTISNIQSKGASRTYGYMAFNYVGNEFINNLFKEILNKSDFCIFSLKNQTHFANYTLFPATANASVGFTVTVNPTWDVSGTPITF